MESCTLAAAPGITLDLIDLPLPMEGYHDFFGIWLLRDEARDRTALFDVGPASTVPLLLEELKTRNIRKLDHILLSHIHLDHSGGLAQVLQAFPSARVAVHPMGKRHLAEPERLWNSSLEVIPEMALAYGKPSPVDESVFLPEPAEIPGISAIDTPGHAPHHRSYLYRAGAGTVLFSGEAASTYNHLGKIYPGADDRAYLLRPSTPPRFYLDNALASIEKMKAADATFMCYAHFGYTGEVRKMLQEAGDQLLLWRELFLEYLAKESSTRADEVDINKLAAFVLERDPWLAVFSRLPGDMQSREMGFLTSSATGFLGAVTG
ncbi:MAG: MBL fold metallo-hydrolase [Thermovirgaceae bacterium]|nr:MBL fold metallo-hydrolase [Thermovirgaceae bacterium]